MFFPALTRRADYRSPYSRGDFYADYKEYADEISEDCQHRCVYCDATMSENMGGDNMQLDHFRPQKLFPELCCDPNNLVLSCPACNRLKSDHWPADKSSGRSYSGIEGFIDPFSENRLMFFELVETGTILAKKDPAGYIIKLLCMDRPARRTLRKRRILRDEARTLLATARENMMQKKTKYEAGEISSIELCNYIDIHDTILQSLESILKGLG